MKAAVQAADTRTAATDDLEAALAHTNAVKAYLEEQLAALDAPADGVPTTTRQRIAARRLEMLREPAPLIITGTRDTILATLTDTLTHLDRDDLYCLNTLAVFAVSRNEAASRAVRPGRDQLLIKLRASHPCKKSTEPLFLQGPRTSSGRQWTCLSCNKPVEMLVGLLARDTTGRGK
jgi:hypothetical protein